MTSPALTGIATTDADAAASTVLGPDAGRGPGIGAAAAAPDAEPQETAYAAGGYVEGPSVATYRAKDGRVHYASPRSKATQDKVAAQEWAEVDPEHVDEQPEPFDPTAHLVREVVTHLEEHADDADEVARVKAAEAAGEDRPTIRDWQPGE